MSLGEKQFSAWCRMAKATLAYNGITISAFAKRIGRSRASVSYALNGWHVSNNTIQLIQAGLETLEHPQDAFESRKEVF